MITVRTPTPLDTRPMADLLNAIIKEGGTTALTRPVTGQDIADWMAEDADRSAWQVALDEAGAVVGFQWVCPKDRLPASACDIATFVKIGRTGLGIGSALFTATAKAAKALGYHWINATIRADNTGGLTYYQSRGFRDWRREEGVALDSGLVVDRISKRYDI
ncbi:GNAT family N-acetyltransferase [Roseobacter ponti]|uniref:GNAT family N-acetyltransferase n=1 Tax=Roseobacter ponti TaxID=1891787 RepID=A0A858SPT5_9RHOB|nr:GNAT family N-acetyltransferase [Roseobacter ponti]QJF49703.1 GNAT family N-acetyltransferase [Roseobacter ponti]